MRSRNLVIITLVSLGTQGALADRISVPEARFQMGCSAGDRNCEADEGQAGGIAVSVPAFLMDRNEVAVAEYRACVAAGKCTEPLTNRRANLLGLHGMHGNVGEWTANWFAPDAISALYAKGDLQGPTQGRQRVVRGGSWDENRLNLRSSFRNVKPPQQGDSIYGSIGFRCVADPSRN